MRLFSFSFTIVFMMVTWGCQRPTSVAGAPEPALGATSEPHTATMWVHGMGCPQCAYNVDLQLLKVPGVEAVKVDMGTGRVVARLSPENPPSREQLANAIVQTGFTLKRLEISR